MRLHRLWGAILVAFTVYIFVICQPIWADTPETNPGFWARFSIVVNHITTVGAFFNLPTSSSVIVDYPVEDLEREIWDLGKANGRKEYFKFQFLDNERVPIFESDSIGGRGGSVEIDYDRDLIPLIETLIRSGKKATTLKLTHNHDLLIGAHEFSLGDISVFRTTKAILEEAGLNHIDFEGSIVYKSLTGKLKARAVSIPNGVSWRNGDYRISRPAQKALNSQEYLEKFYEIRLMGKAANLRCHAALLSQ